MEYTALQVQTAIAKIAHSAEGIQDFPQTVEVSVPSRRVLLRLKQGNLRRRHHHETTSNDSPGGPGSGVWSKEHVAELSEAFAAFVEQNQGDGCGILLIEGPDGKKFEFATGTLSSWSSKK